MHILADKVIADAARAFAVYGEVIQFDGRHLDPALLKSADILLVRSVTRVNEQLLDGTPIKFVGTATAGTDHIEQESLKNAGVQFASAPGCNANAVAEFITTSILLFCAAENLQPEATQVAIIGHGSVGSQVEIKLQALGFRCLLNDPIKVAGKQAGTALQGDFVSLETALKADIVTLHTPLTYDGPYPTHRLIDAAKLADMDNCRLLINAARGGIVDESALSVRLNNDETFHALLDCWENEPQINRGLIEQVFRSSPHVAGHSIEARLNATGMLAESLSAWSGVKNDWSAATESLSNESSNRDLDVDSIDKCGPGSRPAEILGAIAKLLDRCCPVTEISLAMQEFNAVPEDKVSAYFDGLRRQFAVRREFSFYKLPIELSHQFPHNSLSQLGFRVS